MRESHGDFKAYLRMQPEMLHDILVRVAPRITKSEERRPALNPGLKLAIALCFLTTGNSYHRLAFDFRVAHDTISLFVPKVCNAIVAEFKEELMTTPSTPDELKEVATKFGRRWNFGQSTENTLPSVNPRIRAARCPSGRRLMSVRVPSGAFLN